MYTYHRLRYATRWNRRLVWTLAILMLLALGYRAYCSWQQAQPYTPEPLGQQV
jgi:hypothetical protein